MDELAAELAERDARSERSRYQLAAAVLFGAPILTAMITATAVLIVEVTGFRSEMIVLVAVSNAALAAIGSGFGVWIEPGDRRSSKIAGLLGGSLYGFLLYMIISAVALYLIELVFTP